jgi:hypothetical protein
MSGYCETCNNTGYIDCHCGGDLCFCGRVELECPACGGYGYGFEDDEEDYLVWHDDGSPSLEPQPPARETDEPVGYANPKSLALMEEAGAPVGVWMSKTPDQYITEPLFTRPQSPKSPDRDALVEALREAREFIDASKIKPRSPVWHKQVLAKIDDALAGSGERR